MGIVAGLGVPRSSLALCLLSAAAAALAVVALRISDNNWSCNEITGGPVGATAGFNVLPPNGVDGGGGGAPLPFDCAGAPFDLGIFPVPTPPPPELGAAPELTGPA